MRPLIFDYTSTFGGAFEQALSLAVELARLPGYEVGFVSAQGESELENRVPEKITALQVPPYSSFSTSSDGGVIKAINNTLDILSELPRGLRLARFAKKQGSQLIMMNNLINMQQSGVIASKLAGMKSISCHQDFEFDSRSARYFAGVVDHHVAISEVIKENLIGLGVPEHKISIIHNGIDTNRFRADVPPFDLEGEFGITSDKLVFALFGRLVPWKGHEVFLRAAQQIIAEVPNAVGLIIGDTSDGEESYERELRALASELGISEQIVFAGYQRDVPSLLTAADVVLHLSIRPEPFGLVVSEAMACAKPIVAMAEGGPLEIVEQGKSGFLAEPRNPSAVAKAAIPLLKDENLRKQIGKTAEQRAQQLFSSEICAKRYDELFRKVLDS